jgi:acyl-CoA synthetase (AMP-forming)/AMP-acid ligase II
VNATRAALQAAGSRVMLVDGTGRSRTGEDLVHSIDRLAGALTERGLVGARVGIWFTNSIAAVEAHLAVEWVGGTRVPVDPNASPAEAARTWEAAGVRDVLVDVEHAGVVTPRVLVHDDDFPMTGSPRLPVDDVPPHRTSLLYPRAVDGGRLIAVPISYGNWEATMATNVALYRGGGYGPGFGPDEHFLTVQQLMHGTGLVGTFPFLRMGLPQTIVRRFDADVVLDILRAGTVTTTMVVTTMLARLADAARRRPGGLGAVRRMLYGGAPLMASDLQRAARTFEGVLVQIYGRLEGGWPITVLDQDDHRKIAAGDAVRASSCGRPVGDSELRLRSNGEICVRSDMVVAEYADPDGWCSLGDLGRIEGEYLHLDGRFDRMINTGYHVYPQEIEAAIRRVPGVAAALVRGEPDSHHGTAVVAHIVGTDGARPDDLVEAVDTALRAAFARYKVPRRYHVGDRLPAI